MRGSPLCGRRSETCFEQVTTAAVQTWTTMCRRGIPAFPFCHVTLRGRKPRSGYPEEPRTLGEHLKRRRLDRGFRQRDVSGVLGVSKATYENWELDSGSRRFGTGRGSWAFWGTTRAWSPRPSGSASRPNGGGRDFLYGRSPVNWRSIPGPSRRGREVRSGSHTRASSGSLSSSLKAYSSRAPGILFDGTNLSGLAGQQKEWAGRLF